MRETLVGSGFSRALNTSAFVSISATLSFAIIFATVRGILHDPSQRTEITLCAQTSDRQPSASVTADSALAVAQGIDYPSSVATDGKGGLYITGQVQNEVYRLSADGRLSIVAGTGTSGFGGDGGPATSAQMWSPAGISVDAVGNIYVADCQNNRIRKVTAAGMICTVAGNGTAGFSGDGGSAISAQLWSPNAVAVDSSGNLYIADVLNNRIRKVTPDGVISTVAGNGTPGFSGDGGPATSAALYCPNGVAVDSSGSLYIADTYDLRIRKVTSAGIISTVAGDGTSGFNGDGGSASSAQLCCPNGVAVDSSGDLYIADTSDHRIRIVTPAGIIKTVAGNGTAGFSGDGGPATSAQLNFPSGIAADSAGNLYIADTYNLRVRRVNPAGIISTIAGDEPGGFSGDGGTTNFCAIGLPGHVLRFRDPRNISRQEKVPDIILHNAILRFSWSV